MKLKRRNHSVPELQMAAMPDLIFTILFFFMIVTHMRENTIHVQYQQPEGSGLVKVTNKAAVINVYVGQNVDGSGYSVQVGNEVVPLDKLTQQLSKARESVPSDQYEYMTASLQADRKVPMYIINKVKMALRNSHILKINYSAIENETIPEPVR